MTRPERVAMYLLDWFGLPWRFQVPSGPYTIDFVVGNVAIEVQGSYWHRLPHCAARDTRKQAWLEAQGFTVLHLWEDQSWAWSNALLGVFVEHS